MKKMDGIYIGLCVCAITAYPVVLAEIYKKILDIQKRLK